VAHAGGRMTMPVLSPRTRLGLEIAAAGVAGGIIGDALLRAMPWGLNVALGTTVLVGTGAWLVRRHHIKPGPDAAWLPITALLLSDIQWNELPHDDRMRHVRRVLLGVALAAPVLLVFAALFASADQVFSNVLTNVFDFNLESVISHTFFMAFWGFLVAGYLRWCMLGRPVQGLTLDAKPITSVVPLATALGLLNALFLLFVVVQLRYFFGGAALVEETSGLTYAEYARRGFFELMTASGLMLPILLGADELVRKGAAPQIRVVRQLSGLLLAFLAVIMVSALQRMRLYVAAFGLSEQRLYATAFMILLVGVFVWFVWTVLRGERQRFVVGALMHGLAVLAGRHVLN